MEIPCSSVFESSVVKLDRLEDNHPPKSSFLAKTLDMLIASSLKLLRCFVYCNKIFNIKERKNHPFFGTWTTMEIEIIARGNIFE